MCRVLKASMVLVAAGLLLAAAAGSVAAETQSKIPSDVPKAGEEKNISAPELAPELLISGAVSPHAIEEALKDLPKTQPDVAASIGGSHSSQLFRRLAPLVVLVITDDGSGSGSILSTDGYVITNNHVILGFDSVGVILKPAVEGAAPSGRDALLADVVKVDQVADLALLKIRDWPQSATFIELGDADAVSIGDDVHAIGHPKGKTWTYTKGVISQMRNGYSWNYEGEFDHQADVIQTQTPINPGNSGGPLFDDEGRMIGVNSFGDDQSQGLNFAISVREVQRFLDAGESRYADAFAPPGELEECTPVVVFTGRSETNDSDVRLTDNDCDDYPEMIEEWFDDKAIGYVVQFDKNGDGKWETLVVDNNADGTWDYSLYDTDGDGAPDLRGLHAGGAWEPSEYERV